MARHHLINGIKVAFTAEEETAWDNAETAWNNGALSRAQANDYSFDTYIAGYFNTTSAIYEIQFKFASGNIDAGDICLYGIN